MRNFLKPGWRRYAVAVVVVAASLGVIGACNPTKKEPPPPKMALLTIAPNEWTYTSQGEVKSFTVTNLGPDQSLPLRRGIFGGNANPAEFVPANDLSNCIGRTLVQGDNCTVVVQHFGVPGAHHDAFLVVGSDNSQEHSPTGNRGAGAHLIGH
jgi:hypothetical protein